jgi:hypothetical protein
MIEQTRRKKIKELLTLSDMITQRVLLDPALAGVPFAIESHKLISHNFDVRLTPECRVDETRNIEHPST